MPEFVGLRLERRAREGRRSGCRSISITPPRRRCAPRPAQAWLQAAETVGNPSSIHGDGQSARRLLEESRERLAATLGCDAIEVVFTSGGTESVNLALKGLWWSRAARARRLRPPGRRAPRHPRHGRVAGRARGGGSSARSRSMRRAAFPWTAFAAALDGAAAGDCSRGEQRGGHGRTTRPRWRRHPPRPTFLCIWMRSPRSATFRCDFSAWRGAAPSGAGLVALSVAAHKLGGPVGIGALVAARRAAARPAPARRGTAAWTARRHPGCRGRRRVRRRRRTRRRRPRTRRPHASRELRDRLVQGVARSDSRRRAARRPGRPAGRECAPALSRGAGGVHPVPPGSGRDLRLHRIGVPGGRRRAVARRARPRTIRRRGATGASTHPRSHLHRGRRGCRARRAARSRRACSAPRHPAPAPASGFVDWGHADPGGDERRSRFRRCGGACRRRRPRGRRRASGPVACGRDAAHRQPRMLHDRGRDGRPSCRGPARDPVLRLGLLGALPRRRDRRLRRGVPRRPHPEPLHALQREDQVRGAARARDRARLRRRVHRSLRGARRQRRGSGTAPGIGCREGPVLCARRADGRAARPHLLPPRCDARPRRSCAPRPRHAD